MDHLSWVQEVISLRLGELDGRDGPFPFVAPDRDSQAMHFVKPNTFHRTGLSVGEDYGFADQLGLGLFELTEDRGRADLCSWHGLVFAFERARSRDRRRAKGCRRNPRPTSRLGTGGSARTLEPDDARAVFIPML